MRFIDLFAGLGGFHVALERLGHECVFASELDANLQDLYEKNFGLRPHGDIRAVPASAIPAHDILCAGSPCQPFSKAGEQQGFDCPKWGDLFEHVIRILKHHKPEHIILENVPNLERHSGGDTWAELKLQTKTSGKIKDHLASIYRIFLREGTMELRFNQELLSYDLPNVLSAPYFKTPTEAPLRWQRDFSFDFGLGLKATGFAALREVASTSTAGFALFRRKRLIEGSLDEPYRPEFIFGSGNSYRKQRLIGEIQLEGNLSLYPVMT